MVIKALVVDDSPVVREFLSHILDSDLEIQVVGSANDGEEALEAVKSKRPDVVTMDIRMPRMNGLEATRLIMEACPTPIVIVSGSLGVEGSASFRAIEAGALAVLQRPVGIDHPDHAAMADELVRTVKLMSEVKVVRRWTNAKRTGTTLSPSSPREVRLNRVAEEIKLVAIGASTGGPVVLQQILAGLPKTFSAPILVVQHISPGFVRGFADWLTESSGFPVHVATHGEPLLPGHVFVAPDATHMGVSKDLRIALNGNEPENGLCPSVSHLFRSVADRFGPAAVGILLTGMGKDGANGLKLMKEKGAVTIVQDEQSSVIHGMPREAINLNAVTYVLSPQGIVSALTRLAYKESRKN